VTPLSAGSSAEALTTPLASVVTRPAGVMARTVYASSAT